MSSTVLKGIGILLVGLVVLLGVYLGVFNGDDKKEDTEIIIEEDGQTQSNESPPIMVVDDKLKSNIITEILNSTDEIYLESLVGADYLVYLSNEDKEGIERILSSLDIANKEKSPIDRNYFYFALYLQSKNIHIYFNSDSIFIEDDEGASGYHVERNGLIELINELENAYLDQINGYVQGIAPTGVVIEAADDNKKIHADEELIQEVKELIQLTEIIDNSDMKLISPEYPLYKVTLLSDSRNAVLTLIDETIVSLNIMGETSYFKNEPELVNLIKEQFKGEDDNEKLLFSPLFESHTVVIDDMSDVYDFEDPSYYRLELIRALMKADKEQTTRSIGPREEIRMSLSFLLQGKELEVLIFDDYIQYDKKTYRSPTIADKLYKVISN